MKTNSLKPFLLFVIFIFSVSINGQELSKEIEMKLDKLQTLMEKDVLNGEQLNSLKYYTEDIVIMPGFNPPLRGINTLREAYEKEKEKELEYHSFSGKVEKRWQRGDEIYEVGSFGMSVSSKESKKPSAYYGSYFQIWQVLNGGEYKIKYIIWNLDFNPCS